jgi:hypothetical protein
MTGVLLEEGGLPPVREVALPLSEPANGSAHARAFVRGALARWQVDDTTMNEVGHVASELVAHAFRAGAGSVDLQLSLDESFVFVQVCSRSRATEAPDEPGTDPAASPELFIVGRLAVDWWARDGADGPVLWAKVQRSVPGDGA